MRKSTTLPFRGEGTGSVIRLGQQLWDAANTDALDRPACRREVDRTLDEDVNVSGNPEYARAQSDHIRLAPAQSRVTDASPARRQPTIKRRILKTLHSVRCSLLHN